MTALFFKICKEDVKKIILRKLGQLKIGSMVYCFIWLSQQAEALQEAVALSKPTISEH